MIPQLDQLRARRSEIVKLAAKCNVRVFGSVARGEAGLASDLDVLVDFEPARSLLDLVGLEQELEEFLDCKVDVVVEGGISPYLEKRILGEAVAL